jgi:thiamine kinase-like enzyme
MSLLDIIQTKTSTARIRAHMAWEQAADRRPTRLSEVPRSVDVVTREWLSAALCRSVPGAQVLDFDLGAPNVGTTSRRPIHVRYNEAGRNAGLQERIFGKATPQFTTRLVCGLSGAIASEVNFYNKVRPLLAIETLDCHYAAFESGSFRSILIFDDISHTKQAKFLDPHHHFTRAEADAIVSMLAALHSRFWDSPQLDRDFVWIKDSLRYQHHINRVIDFGERARLGIERTLDILPPTIRARKDALWPALMRSCELRVAGARTLLHADIHPGNFYLTAANAVGVTDWQCTVKGQWAADVAYALSSCLVVEDRRSWERDLLERYLDALRLPQGAVKPDFDAAWLAYRQQTLHGLFNWLFVAGAGPMQPSMQPEDFGRINLERMATAAADLETLDSLGRC